MIAVMGLDLSVASTGIAAPGGDTGTIKPGSSSDGGRRLHEITSTIGHVARRHRPALVVIEDYPKRVVGGIIATLRIAELGGCVRRDLFELGIPYIEVGTGQLKRFATGNGAATKPQMVGAARAAGARVRNDDEADAWFLRAVGLMAYGEDVVGGRSLLSERLEVVSKFTWPTLRRLADAR